MKSISKVTSLKGNSMKRQCLLQVVLFLFIWFIRSTKFPSFVVGTLLSTFFFSLLSIFFITCHYFFFSYLFLSFIFLSFFSLSIYFFLSLSISSYLFFLLFFFVDLSSENYFPHLLTVTFNNLKKIICSMVKQNSIYKYIASPSDSKNRNRAFQK